MRVTVADDSVLFRERLTRLLTEAGHEVIAAVGDADALVAAVADEVPDIAIIDVRMPPTGTNDGARAAQHLRSLHSEMPMLLLSQHVETRHSVALVASGQPARGVRGCSRRRKLARRGGRAILGRRCPRRTWKSCAAPSRRLSPSKGQALEAVGLAG